MDNAHVPFLVLLSGLLIVVSLQLKLLFERLGLPALVGYLAVGFLLRLCDERWRFLPEEGHQILVFLATLGLATLLFRVGLESQLEELLRQLPKAALVGGSNLLISGLAGFATCRYLLELSWIPSIVVGVAFCATSVGVSVAVWQDDKALNSRRGQLLLDIAELDDIAAVVMMALLFVLLPEFHTGGTSSGMLGLAAGTLLAFLGKLVLFASVCLLFSRYLEKPLTRFLADREPSPDPILSVVGIGFIFAAAAGLFGFSIAIGAFFAGLVFSRDPRAVKMEASFIPVYALFSPFFFIGIGMEINPAVLTDAILPGCILLAAAIVGKLLANGLPLAIMDGLPAAALIGVSMIPRAEITMVIMSRARALGDWVMPPHIYSAVILVSAVTCLGSPALVRRLLQKWPPQD